MPRPVDQLSNPSRTGYTPSSSLAMLACWTARAAKSCVDMSHGMDCIAGTDRHGALHTGAWYLWMQGCAQGSWTVCEDGLYTSDSNFVFEEVILKAQSINS